MIQEFVEQFTYVGIFVALLLASLGVPIPEEIPIVTAAVLSHEDLTRWGIALPVCIAGVLSGDMVLYWIGLHWGERVLNWRVARLVLNPEREARFKAAYRRHAGKTVFMVRRVIGLRAAAFLTAGIARVPFGKFLAADAGAAMLGVPVNFWLVYFLTDQLEEVLTHVHRVQRWLGLLAVVAIAAVLVVAIWRENRRRVTEEP